ncbi:hypothetical protein RKE30_02520 [Streptomyces sp. Li-HN-5-11]|uniref:hypothetical protein n=1 Tax=Streptomyces sp. Li-HN-5-11 TaxID=3075432 RepID=UPI0028B070D6|nr:hypothetical protein [Streptomyces sp. Li-HN-5-11]WNM29347.1 hypothetical protein RKE30_02520 [Streptomyces sp. Li-HN-5-11]
MRGLTDGVDTGPGSTRAQGAFQAAITAVAVLAALGLLVSACGAGGTGARDEGPAHSDSVAGAATAPSPSPTDTPRQVNAVQLIKDDPKVSAAVKRGLKPCAADEYPVDVSYGELTRNSVDDIVINVLTCGDAVGVGAYVYREQGGAYQNVFKAEEPPVYAEIDRGELVVTKQVYEKGDPVSNPSGEDVITYRWTGGRFAKEFSTRNEYSKAVGGNPTTAPDN